MKPNRMIGALLIVALAGPAWADFAMDAASFGVAGDGETDDTAALQRALDACAQQGGGIVRVGTGTYVIRGHLHIPDHVTLEGVFTAPTAWSQGKGTTLCAYEGRGSEEGPPFITLNLNSTLKGVTVYYPEQTGEEGVLPYPWCVAAADKDNATLQDCLLVNPYQAIDLGTRRSGRHFVSGVYGCPLRRGLFVSQCYDVGRVQNVHFWPFFSAIQRNPEVGAFVQENGEAFIFGRTDWEYVFNTFCWGYKIGYRFIETEHGSCNGNFLGIGADACNVSFQVDNCAPYGLLITNGEFVAFPGPNPTEIVVKPSNRGVVQFNNCAFWGPSHQCARVEGTGFVSFNQCNFVQWDVSGTGAACVDALSGSLVVTACRFAGGGRGVQLGARLRGAVVTGNFFSGRDSVAVDPGTLATVESNLVAIPPIEVPAGSMVLGVDDPHVALAGDWRRYSGLGSFAGFGRWSARGDGSATFRWNMTAVEPGTYTLSAWVPEDPNGDHAPDAAYRVRHADGETEVKISQKDILRSWVPLGKFRLDTDSCVVLSNQASGNVVADALLLTKAVE